MAGFTGSGVICLGEMKLCGIVCFGVVSRELANTLLDCHSAKKTKKKEKQTAHKTQKYGVVPSNAVNLQSDKVQRHL